MDWKLLMLAAMAVLLLAVVGCGPPERSIPKPPPTPTERANEMAIKFWDEMPYAVRHSEDAAAQFSMLLDKAHKIVAMDTVATRLAAKSIPPSDCALEVLVGAD